MASASPQAVPTLPPTWVDRREEISSSTTNIPVVRNIWAKRNFSCAIPFINLDYVYVTLSESGGENPLDYEKMAENPMEWYIAGTDATTGKSRFFDRNDIHQDGCDKVVLILTKPVDEILTSDTDEKPLRQRLPGWGGNS